MRLLFILLLLWPSSLLLAQPQAYSGKAKPFVDKFWKLVDDLKKAEAGPESKEEKIRRCRIIADNAMTQIGHIRRRDPEFDTKPLESEVQPFIDAAVNAVNAHNARIADKISNAAKDGEGCGGVFMADHTVEIRSTGDLKKDIENHKQQLLDYNAKVARLKAANSQGLGTCEKFIRDRLSNSREFILKKIKEARTENEITVMYAYRDLLGQEAYWKAITLIYPEMEGGTSLYKMVTDTLQALGALEDVIVASRKKKMERLKAYFMPKAVTNNASMEDEFREAFSNEGWNEKIIRINLLTRDWSIIRNQLTGAILCRTQMAAIVAKQQAGNCVLYIFTLKQNYNGSSYSTVSSRYSHDVLENEFLCENAR